MEMIAMMKHDLKFITPDENGVRVCDLSLKELSRLAVKLTDEMIVSADDTNNNEKNNLMFFFFT
jgi:hypothetical protein